LSTLAIFPTSVASSNFLALIIVALCAEALPPAPYLHNIPTTKLKHDWKKWQIKHNRSRPRQEPRNEQEQKQGSVCEHGNFQRTPSSDRKKVITEERTVSL